MTDIFCDSDILEVAHEKIMEFLLGDIQRA